MKKSLFSLSLVALALSSVAASAQEYPSRYMDDSAKLVTAPNGAVINAEVLQVMPQNVYTEKTIEKVTDGVWVVGGLSIANATVIEAPDGLIVYDTGDYAEEGKHIREIIEKEISKKPIKAIIYSHSHYALGGGAMVDDPSKVTIIGHEKLNDTVKENLQSGGLKATIPELGPVMSARAAIQFSTFLPAEGKDAGLAGKLEFKEPAFLPVNRTVKNGETVNVAGLDIQFFTDYKSDDYSVTAWIPSKKVVMNNFFWPGTVNLYSLRGASYRDPQEWRDALTLMRDLKPEYLVSTHTRAVKGAKKVSDTLINYSDMITLTYDQALRGILKGLGPDELRYFVYKPKHLADAAYNKESYGESYWYTPATFYEGLGWYDRDATKLYQLPKKEESTRLVKLMGGEDKVIAAAKDAYDNNEYAWSAQLVNHVYLINPNNQEARQLKADSLRKLGQISVSSIGRSFTISEARALEGLETIPKVLPPKAEVVAADPDTYLNYHRVRIDPKKSENVDKMLAFNFGEKTVGLHVRRGVAEYVENISRHYQKPDIELSMDGSTWARIYLNQSDLATELTNGKAKVTKGSDKEAIQILNLFDKFEQ
ncbi:alkyl sulfatase dimerization domain-containing protein [Vibrio sp. EA2]|uniref:alkyl sulfatase dimerization domain-containing protein n=1 Tax=Vibrio sp. EA2 TaxID=3079860 RepID=UPI00294A2DE0|nr:alkyl sulfatase dimerization domain-containing protein [Vibrio sp. EA2]MDV6249798.1 alkyl sulfatase dimerization domain-containing protein [Vibrio sp. EA2]